MRPDRRALVPPADLRPGRLTLSADASVHLRRVLRVRPGEAVELFDGGGRRARAIVAGAGERGAVEVDVGEPEDGRDVEPALALTLLFALAKGDAPDRVVRACTELGAAALIPVLTARSVPRPATERPARPGRGDRLRRIAEEAARQCGRSVVPAVGAPTPLPEVLAALPAAAALRLLPLPSAGVPPLAHACPDRRPGAAVLLIGPEGGFAEEEEALAREHGFAAVSLGPRVLRAPTAAIAATAIVLHQAGVQGRRPR